MKIRQIQLADNQDDQLISIVSNILQTKKISNHNTLFDKVFFVVNVEEIDDINEFLNRRIWECQYLRAERTSTFESISKINIYISLTEVIDYIYQATAPILRRDIPDNITSLDNIKSILETYLIGDSVMLMHLSMFKRIMKMDSGAGDLYDHDDTGINIIRSEYDKKNIVCVIDNSSVPISQILSESYITQCQHPKIIVEITFNCMTKNDLYSMLTFINDSDGYKCDITSYKRVNNDEYNVCVCIASEYAYRSQFTNIRCKIQKTYSKISK